jgi:hypothetical protein
VKIGTLDQDAVEAEGKARAVGNNTEHLDMEAVLL